jgi:hypothetical protein
MFCSVSVQQHQGISEGICSIEQAGSKWEREEKVVSVGEGGWRGG